MQGSAKTSPEELSKHGINNSQVHVDFMVSSDKMNIDGIKQDGTITPIFRNGNWINHLHLP
ncbi:hypothetical protein EFN35_09230 [Pediococcus parvulus]|nr:hypothetical protein [Pediococcus parvulus]MCT3029621.1 hypothetical protein [Pediococcus parvulus]MCT3030777.1 hypothetical protein [Pediococcus parvulus]MCT3034430.1 hypothetical protein [Pediococcus parvulus]HBO46874.1 hypothetical protein [Pediococcus sp.]